MRCLMPSLHSQALRIDPRERSSGGEHIATFQIVMLWCDHCVKVPFTQKTPKPRVQDLYIYDFRVIMVLQSSFYTNAQRSSSSAARNNSINLGSHSLV
mmetsp:Transcript_2025/g.4577  ORF Transcript_2025/g.4577 Transcript_2025/m.4577 type:complete len:98 (-) Transcript_2025:311-604(-)